MALQKKLSTLSHDRRLLLQLLKGKSADFTEEALRSGKQLPFKADQLKVPSNSNVSSLSSLQLCFYRALKHLGKQTYS